MHTHAHKHACISNFIFLLRKICRVSSLSIHTLIHVFLWKSKEKLYYQLPIINTWSSYKKCHENIYQCNETCLSDHNLLTSIFSFVFDIFKFPIILYQCYIYLFAGAMLCNSWSLPS